MEIDSQCFLWRQVTLGTSGSNPEFVWRPFELTAIIKVVYNVPMFQELKEINKSYRLPLVRTYIMECKTT